MSVSDATLPSDNKIVEKLPASSGDEKSIKRVRKTLESMLEKLKVQIDSTDKVLCCQLRFVSFHS